VKPIRDTLLREIMRSYDGKAPFYDALHRYEQKVKYSIVLGRIKRHLREATSCLDCGCGTGLLLEELRNIFRGSRGLIGLDISVGMLKEALSKMGRGGFHLVRGNSNNIPFPDSSFDLIFAFTILDGEVNGLDTLKELCRVCSSKGIIVASALKSSPLASRFMEYAAESGLKIIDIVDLKGLNEIILTLGKINA